LADAAPAAGKAREELAGALALGELLVLAAVVVLAPLLRLEDSYVPAIRFPPQDLVGEGYFLWLLGILGILTAARIAAAGRFAVPEPATAALLGVWALYVVARGAASDHPFEARNQAFAWLTHCSLFALVLAAAGGKDSARRWLFAAVAAGLVLESIRAVWQLKVGLPEMRMEVLADAGSPEVDMQSPVARSRFLSEEPFNSFISPNSLGGWMALAASAAAGLAAGYWADARSRLGEFGAGRLLGLAASWAPALAVFGWAFYLTGSKGAWLALAGAAAGTLAASPPASEERRRRRLRLVGGACLVLAALAALVWWLQPGLPGRDSLAASVNVRLGYWRAAATMAGEHPAFGVGPGTFGARFPALKGPLAEEAQSAHCAWMETAAEYGLAGLVLLAAFWALVLWRLWRRRVIAGQLPGREQTVKQATMVLLAGLGANCVFGWLKFGPEDLDQFSRLSEMGAPFGTRLLAFAAIRAIDFPVIWAAAFALVAWPLAARSGTERPEAAERWLIQGAAVAVGAFLLHSSVEMDMGMRVLAGSALALTALALAGPGCRETVLLGGRALAGSALVAVLAVGTLWCGAREYFRAEALVAQSAPLPDEVAAGLARTEEEIARLNEALKDRPQDGELLRRVADARRRLDGFRAEAAVVRVERLATAVRADPENYYLRVNLANACNKARNLTPSAAGARKFADQAEQELREAARLAPGRVTPRRMLGRWLLLEGRYGQAALEFERVKELYPLKAETFLEWGDAALLDGKTPRARGLYRTGLDTSRRVGDEAIHLSVLFEAPGQMLWETPKLDALAAALDMAVKDQPGDGALLLRRALVEVARDNPREALELLRRAASAEPRDAELALFEAYGLRLAGEPEKALDKMADVRRLERAPGTLPAGPRAVDVAVYRTRQILGLGLGRRVPAAGDMKGPAGAAREPPSGEAAAQ